MVLHGPGTLSSYRTVAYGLLAAMRELYVDFHGQEIHHYLDNKAVVDVANAPHFQAVAASDVWDEIRTGRNAGEAGTMCTGQKATRKKRNHDVQIRPTRAGVIMLPTAWRTLGGSIVVLICALLLHMADVRESLIRSTLSCGVTLQSSNCRVCYGPRRDSRVDRQLRHARLTAVEADG